MQLPTFSVIKTIIERINSQVWTSYGSYIYGLCGNYHCGAALTSTRYLGF